MKTLLITLQKGGVGKSATATQFARYLRNLELRVLVIELDDQRNATNALARGAKPFTSMGITSSEMLNGATAVPDGSGQQFLVADSPVKRIAAAESEKYSTCASNLIKFIEAMDGHFDICLIDTPPADSILVTMPLMAADYVLSPIELAQECIEGMSNTLTGERGILKIKQIREQQNMKPIVFLGFLPNIVEKNARQKRALEDVRANPRLARYFAKDATGKVMLIPKREAIAKAQQDGKALFEMVKESSSAKQAWSEVAPVFQELTEQMGLFITAFDQTLESITSDPTGGENA